MTSPSIIPSSRWFRASVLTYASIFYTTTTHAFSTPSPQIPPFINPQTPEEVVQNQLFHYQIKNLESAFSYNSPENKQATGTISDFETSLQTPPYNLLVNHERADVLLEVIPDGMFHEDDTERENYDTALCLVCIRPNKEVKKNHPVWFWWELSRNIDDEDEEDVGEQWMVDCIIPDFEDLDFETDSLTIEEFGEGDDDDELTIYWDVGGL
ncbi:hypothetical protein QTG54_008050 [Skeletonema marinoi]|uniref:Uncharacterized protein n=1 Tax=Skeletonema marinoi TaxID=267567 RepID=A0AAD8Y8P9_9STRA|nr:hypothetical protein QTG54_008050 [Skeletonema marinoi]